MNIIDGSIKKKFIRPLAVWVALLCILPDMQAAAAERAEAVREMPAASGQELQEGRDEIGRAHV